MSEMDAGLCNAVQQGARQYFQGRPAQQPQTQQQQHSNNTTPITPPATLKTGDPASDEEMAGTKSQTATNNIPSTGIGPAPPPPTDNPLGQKEPADPLVSKESATNDSSMKDDQIKSNDDSSNGPAAETVPAIEEQNKREDAKCDLSENGTISTTPPNSVDESQKQIKDPAVKSDSEDHIKSVQNNIEPESANDINSVVCNNSAANPVSSNVNVDRTERKSIDQRTEEKDVSAITDLTVKSDSASQNIVCLATNTNSNTTPVSSIVAPSSNTGNTSSIVVNNVSAEVIRPLSNNSDGQNQIPSQPGTPKPPTPLQNVWRPPTPSNRTTPTSMYGNNTSNNPQQLLRYDHSNDSTRLLQHAGVDQQQQQKMMMQQYAADMKVAQQQQHYNDAKMIQQHNDSLHEQQRLQQHYSDSQKNDSMQHLRQQQQPHIVQYSSSNSVMPQHQRLSYSNPATPMQQYNSSSTMQQARGEVNNQQQPPHLYNNTTPMRQDAQQQQQSSQQHLYGGKTTPKPLNVATSVYPGNLKRQHDSPYNNTNNRVVYASSNSTMPAQRASTYTPAGQSKPDPTTGYQHHHLQHRSGSVTPNNLAPKHPDASMYSMKSVMSSSSKPGEQPVLYQTSKHNPTSQQQLYHVRAPTPKQEQQYSVAKSQHEQLYSSAVPKPGYNPQQQEQKVQHSSPHIAHHVSQQYPGAASAQYSQNTPLRQNSHQQQPSLHHQSLQQHHHQQHQQQLQHQSSLQQHPQHQMYHHQQPHIRSSSHSPAGGSRTTPGVHPASASALHSAPVGSHEASAGAVRAATTNTGLLTGGLAEQPIEQLARPASLESDRSTPRARPAYPPQQAQQYSTTTSPYNNQKQPPPPQQQRYISQQQHPPPNTATATYQQPSNKSYHEQSALYKNNNTKTPDQQQPGQQYQQPQYQYANKVSGVKTVYPGVYQQPEQHVVHRQQQQQRVPPVPQQQHTYTKSQQPIPVSQAQYHQQLYSTQQQQQVISNNNNSSNSSAKSNRETMHKLTAHRHRSASVVAHQPPQPQYPLATPNQPPRFQYASNQTLHPQNVAQQHPQQTRIIPPSPQQQQTRVVPQQQQQPQPLLKCNSVTSNTVVNASKRESPLDLSVKTVRTSADSTAKDDSNSNEQLYLHQHQQQQHEAYKYMRQPSQYPPQPQQQRLPTTPGYEIRIPVVGQQHTTVVHQQHPVNNTASHKVDFLPKFNVSTLKPSGDYAVRSVAQQQQPQPQYSRQQPAGSVIQQHQPHKNIAQQHSAPQPMKHSLPQQHPGQQQHGLLPVQRKRPAPAETQMQQPSKIQRMDVQQHPVQQHHQQHPSLQLHPSQRHPSLQQQPGHQHPTQHHLQPPHHMQQPQQHPAPHPQHQQHPSQQQPAPPQQRSIPQHHPMAQHPAVHPAQHPVSQQHPQPIPSPQKHPDYAHYRLPSTNVYDVDAQRYMNYAITPLLLQQQQQQPTNIARLASQPPPPPPPPQQHPQVVTTPYNTKNAQQSGADKRILNLLRSSLESKEAERARLDKELKAIENNKLLQQQQQQQLQQQQQKQNSYERQPAAPSVYKLQMPRAVDSIRFEVEDHNQNEQPVANDNKTIIKPNDENGIAALLAARIRTKAELKGFTQQQQQREKTVAVIPRKRVFSKTDDDDVIIIDPVDPVKNNQTPAQLPARDKSGLRSSSETSVYDFRDSESETEMPVLERQSLDDLRKDRRNSLCNGISKSNEGDRLDPGLLEGPMLDQIKTEKPEDSEGAGMMNGGDNIWGDVCEQFVEELITGVKKRRGRRKKANIAKTAPVLTDCSVSLETVTMEKPLSDIKIEQDVVVNVVDIVRSENKCYDLLNGIKQEKADQEPIIVDRNTDKEADKTTDSRKREESTSRIDTDSDDSDVPLSKHLKSKSGDDKKTRKEKSKTRKLDTSSSEDDDSDTESKKKTLRMRTRKQQSETSKTPVKERKMVLRSRESKSRSPSKSTTNTTSADSKGDLKPNRIRYGDGSDFYPGWEEGVYKYKQSLRMPARLISVTRLPHWPRLSTSLPDLDPCPNSPTPSSIADINECTPVKKSLTERIKRHDESDQDSNSSFNCAISEASSSTIYSSASKMNKKENNNSIVDVLIQKYGNGNLGTKANKKRKSKAAADVKLEDVPKVIPKTGNEFELLATPGKNDDSILLGTFRKETITNFRDAFLNNTGGRLGATEEFSPTVYKSRTRTETRVLRQRATIREVFGEDRPASAPPMSRHGDESEDDSKNTSTSTSITGKSIATSASKITPVKVMIETMNVDEQITVVEEDKVKSLPVKKKLKWRSMRRKFSSGFDYIRKKKKIIRNKDESESVDGDGNKSSLGSSTGTGGKQKPKRRGWFSKPNPESVNDIQKEIKGWVMNKGVGETHLHRAARLGYTDVTAYCLEKLSSPPSPRDNAGYTPLHEACSRGHLDIARLLLQYGAGVSDSAHSGIRPLHEAAENGYVEIIRLLLSYGADPLLATYSGQTPLSLATDEATVALLRDHLADVQGDLQQPADKPRPWCFAGPATFFENKETGFNVLDHPPSPDPPPEESDIDVEVSDHPLPPLYSIKGESPTDYWVLLQDLSAILKIKSKDTLLKQINPSQPPSATNHDKAILKEFKMADFLEKTTCSHLMCAGEKINIRSSKITMVKYGDKVKQLLGIEKVAVTVR